MECHLAHLSRQERALVECLKEGTVFGPETHDRSHWPTVRAHVIRNVFRNMYKDVTPDSRGLRLRHVCVAGRLDLDEVEANIPLELDQCELFEGMTAARAKLASLRLLGLSIERNTTAEAVFNFESLHVEELDLTGTKLINRKGPALIADGLSVGSNAHFKKISVRGNSAEGAVRLRGAMIGGRLVLTGARLTNGIGPALYANGLTVRASAYLDKGFTAQGEGSEGAVRLRGATIEGWLSLKSARLIDETGPALVADRLTVASNAYFDKTFTAHGNSKDEGTIHLPGAKIGGKLVMTDARLANKSGSALVADRLTVASDAHFDKTFTADGCSKDEGTIHLQGARIGGKLVFRAAQLTNNCGPALYANGLTVASNAYLDEKFTARGAGPMGAVRMRGATIRGWFRLSAARLIGDAGPDLYVDGLTVEQNCYLDLLPPEGTPNSQTASVSTTKKRRVCRSEYAAVVLTGTNVGATLEISCRTLEMAQSAGGWDITGLTYRALEANTAQNWLDFLRQGPREYSPQPYQQFAAFARAQGEERLTQKILIAQRNDQLTRSRGHSELLTLRQKAGLLVLRLTVGYGYRTWLALVWLIGIVVVAVWLANFFGAAEREALFRPASPGAGGDDGPCRAIDLWILGLETIPLISMVPEVAADCTVADTRNGAIYLAVSIVLKLLAWALVTLFIAGYSNIVRKAGP